MVEFKLSIYITKIVVNRFSFYTFFYIFATYCFWSCNSISDLHSSVIKEEITAKKDLTTIDARIIISLL